jgi:hypothetical protein
MLDFSELNELAPAIFQQEVRHQVQLIMEASQLRPLAMHVSHSLMQPGNWLTRRTATAVEWRWAWLVPLIAGSSVQRADLARLTGAIECLQVAATRQTLGVVAIDSRPEISQALYAQHYALNQSLVTLALELVLKLSAEASSRSLACLLSINATCAQLNLALQESSEELLATLTGADAYVLTIGRRQAVLGGGAAEVAASLANFNSAETASWRQFGYNLGVVIDLLEQLEFCTKAETTNQVGLPLQPLPLIYALTQSEDKSELEAAWQRGEWQQLKRLILQSGSLDFSLDLAADWLQKTRQALAQLAIENRPEVRLSTFEKILDDCQKRLGLIQ